MAATELTGKPNASCASGSAVAVRLQGPLSSRQPAMDTPCKGSRFSGSPLRTVCAVWTRTYLRCPLVAAERCVTNLEGRGGLPVPQAGGQRKVVLAHEVRRFARPCSRSWHCAH